MEWRVSHRRYALPLRAVLRTARGEWRAREGLFLRLKDESGRTGLGEAAPVPWFGMGDVDTLEAGARSWEGRMDPERLGSVGGCLGFALRSAARAWAQPAGAAREHVAVAALLPAGRAALARVAERLEAGFRCFKWKVGVEAVADELVLLEDLLGRLPGGAKLRLDANGAWDRRTAERWLDRCAEYPVEFIEQPVAPEARGAADLLLGLAGDYPTPLALDESLVGDGDVERWIGMGWPGVFVVKPALFGDPATVLGRLAKAGAPVVFSSALETVVGAEAALRWALAWPGELRAVGFGVWPLFADGRFDGPAAAPFIRRVDLDRLQTEAAWNALS